MAVPLHGLRKRRKEEVSLIVCFAEHVGIHLAVNLRLNWELYILCRIHFAINLRLNCKFVIYWVGLLRNCCCICRMRLLRNSQLSKLRFVTVALGKINVWRKNRTMGVFGYIFFISIDLHDSFSPCLFSFTFDWQDLSNTHCVSYFQPSSQCL